MEDTALYTICSMRSKEHLTSTEPVQMGLTGPYHDTEAATAIAQTEGKEDRLLRR